jgi:hypothetical protein
MWVNVARRVLIPVGVVIAVPITFTLVILVSFVVLAKLPSFFVPPARQRAKFVALSVAYTAALLGLLLPVTGWQAWFALPAGLFLAVSLIDAVPPHMIYPSRAQRRAVRAAARRFEATSTPANYRCSLLAADGRRHVVACGWPLFETGTGSLKCYHVEGDSVCDLGELIARHHLYPRDLARSVLVQTRTAAAEDLLKKLGGRNPEFEARTVL